MSNNEWEERYQWYKEQGMDRFEIILIEDERCHKKLIEKLRKAEQEEEDKRVRQEENKEKKKEDR